MKIEKTTFGKKNSIVTIDGKDYSFHPESVIIYRIKEGDEIDEKKLTELTNHSEFLLCKDYLFTQLEKYDKTAKGYKDKLFAKGFNARAIRETMNYVVERGYVNDAQFAERYYQLNRSKKGVFRIKQELKIKGVSEENLKFLTNEKDDLQIIKNVAEKFIKNREKTPENKNKLIRHLFTKGYKSNEIFSIVNSIFSSDDFFEDTY